MSKTRNLSDLLDANGDVKSTALDNVPASNDASALTTGTLPDARLSTNVTQNSSTQTLTNKTINASSNTLSNIPNSALTNSSITINGSATSLGGSTTINTDLVNDTTPQLGGDLDTNGNNISLPDSNGSTTNQIKLGTSNDLQIFHDGSNSWIKDVGTGSLVLQGTNLLIRTNNGDNVITATENAEVTLAYDNATKLQTTSTGVNVTGALTVNGSALASGITQADIWRVYSNFNGSASTINNWERADNTDAGLIGTGMSQSGGTFTFPETGIYLVKFQIAGFINGDSRHDQIYIRVSNNSGSTYSTLAVAEGFIQATQNNNTHNSFSTECLVDVTNASTFRCQFRVDRNDVSVTTYTDSNANRTFATFIRLGDT